MKKILIAFSLLLATPSFSDEEDISTANSMYEVLKKEYSNQDNMVPKYEDFSRIGDDDRNCVEIKKDTPNTDKFVAVYLYVKHFMERGPLFPARTVKKIIVNPQGNLEQIFNFATSTIKSDILNSVYRIDKKSFWKTSFKKRDELIFFKNEGKVEGKNFQSYGYCYFY